MLVASRLLDRIGFGRVRLNFTPSGFGRVWCEVLVYVDVMGHVGILISMVKTVTENVMATEIQCLVMADQVIATMRTLFGDS